MTLSKIEPGLAFILPHYNADERTRNAATRCVLHFCEHTMQQNATAAGAPPRTQLGKLTALLLDLLTGFNGVASRRGGGAKGGREKEERSKEGGKVRKGKLEHGRRLAKAGPDLEIIA